MSENGTALATRGHASVVDFTQAQVALVKRTICKPKNRDASNDELALFIGQCKRTGLDPFAKQIYAVFRWSSNDNREVMTIQTGIDGLRTIAERTGRYLGQLGPFWCGTDGEWREAWFSDKPPAAAKVLVRKVIGEHVAETAAIAHWTEYAVTGKGGQMWKDKPAHMLAKCAEALALRKAFPNDMRGLYVDAEMARADALAPPTPIVTATCAPEDGASHLEARERLTALVETVHETKTLTLPAIKKHLVAAGATDTSSIAQAVATLPEAALADVEIHMGGLLGAASEGVA